MTPDATATDSPHLLVVDDDARLRDLLRRYLTGNGFRVTAASLRAQSDIPILMLTARSEPEDRIAGLERGVDDYLGKPFEPRELMLRLSALLRRAQASQEPPHREVRMGPYVFDVERGELRRDGTAVKLTGSEAQLLKVFEQLLKVFAANAGRPFSRAALCTRLNIALERSIDVQVTRLRRKIEEDPKFPIYLQTVRGIGYVLVPDLIG